MFIDRVHAMRHTPTAAKSVQRSTYVCAELGKNEASDDGIVEFMDPSTHADFVGLEVGKKKVWLNPSTGMAIVFPSWSEHWVHPY